MKRSGAREDVDPQATTLAVSSAGDASGGPSRPGADAPTRVEAAEEKRGAPLSLASGALFAGRYRIVRQIAAGGMGAVYEVVHQETDRRRALKVMHSHVLESPDALERFRREARITANVSGEHVVEVIDAGVDEATKTPFLVMELLEGEDLSKRVRRLGRRPPREVVLHLHQAAVALERAHEASIVHRDIKPENLYLARVDRGPPRLKILDFGIAKLVADGSASAGHTQSLGTPIYMAPEQFRTDVRLSSAADVFALGMVAYTLLIGAPYWREESANGNVFALVATAMRGPSEPPTERARRQGITLPSAFDVWFQEVTHEDPARRPASATAAIAALARVFGLLVSESGAVVDEVPGAPEDGGRIDETDAPAADALAASGSLPASGGAARSAAAPAVRRVPPALVAAAAVIAIGLSAVVLRGTSASSGGLAAAVEPGEALTRIKAHSGGLRVGMDTAFGTPPFYFDVAGKADGYDVRFARHLARSLLGEPRMEIVPAAYTATGAGPALLDTLKSGGVDVVISGYQRVEEPGLGWSDPYFDSTYCLLVRSESAVRRLADAGSGMVGVFPDPATVEVLRTRAPGLSFRSDWQDGHLLALAGRGPKGRKLDAFVYDCPYALAELEVAQARREIDSEELCVADSDVFPEAAVQYRVAFRDEDTDLGQALTRAVAAWRSSPEEAAARRELIQRLPPSPCGPPHR